MPRGFARGAAQMGVDGEILGRAEEQKAYDQCGFPQIGRQQGGSLWNPENLSKRHRPDAAGSKHAYLAGDKLGASTMRCALQRAFRGTPPEKRPRSDAPP